ncbi:MAG: energy transducer TonB [Blastocatellia bacterium]
MKVFVIAFLLFVINAAQTESFEKKALSAVRQIPASALDAKLPNRPFATWFNDLVGPETGVVWQLAECGAPINTPGGDGEDLPACAEATVILSNGGRVIIAISVGTFKKGIVGEPAFFRGVLESGEQLYQIRRLNELPEMLRAPAKLLRRLPDIQAASLPQVNRLPYLTYLSSPAPNLNFAPGGLMEAEMLPPPPISLQQSQKPRKVLDGLSEGSVITRVKPVYPASARSMNAFGKVEVRIIISEAGRVIEATAVSGHPALRSAAVDAARKWVYKPTTLNGAPIKVESLLTFTFTTDSQ